MPRHRKEENMALVNRYEGNPILCPVVTNDWESLMVYNCAAIYLGGKVHILYRARATIDGVSRIGYACSGDGYHIDERLTQPVFTGEPANELESLGCEDPRLTQIGDRIYMCYSAYGNVPRLERTVRQVQVAMTSISVDDFLARRWDWGERIYPFPRVDNKNACLFPEKIGGRYAMLHRIPPHIWIAYSEDLLHWHDTRILMSPREGWEYFKLGPAGPPIETEAGWLLIYHAVDRHFHYRLGIALLDLANPKTVLKRSRWPLLEPETDYETKGVIPNVVFSCGAVVIEDELFLYYGGADTVVGVATGKLSEIVHFQE
jgi:predicted GH43/DUF377 family glycosyl hydrolase